MNKEKELFYTFREKHPELFTVIRENNYYVSIDENTQITPLVKAKIIKNTNLFSEGQNVYIIDSCYTGKYIVLGRYRRKGRFIIREYTGPDIFGEFTFKAVYDKRIIKKLKGYHIHDYTFYFFLGNPLFFKRHEFSENGYENITKNIINLETFIFNVFKRFNYFPEALKILFYPSDSEFIKELSEKFFKNNNFPHSVFVKIITEEFIKNNLDNLEEKIFNIFQEIFKEDVGMSKLVITPLLVHSKVLSENMLSFLYKFSEDEKGSFYLIERINSNILDNGFDEKIRFNLLLDLSSKINSSKEVFKILRKYYQLFNIEQLKKLILSLYENYSCKLVVNLVEKFPIDLKEEIYLAFKNHLSPYLSFIENNSENFDELFIKLLNTNQKEKVLLSFIIKNY